MQYSNRRLHKMRGGNIFFRAVILAMMLSFCAEGRRKNPSEEQSALPKKLKAGDIKTPMIIVPGSGGSQIEGKLNKPSVIAWYCAQKTSEYFTLWLQKSSLLPYSINCWTDNMRLVYDERTNTVKNAPGVETRVPGFGTTETIEYLDTQNLIAYFKSIVDTLVSLGYERGVSVRGAPYDFRYGPESASKYFSKLKKLVEETYAANGNRKITLMSHSLGGPYTLVFLNKQSQDWKDKHILQWISLNGALGGVAEIMQVFTSGYTLGIPHLFVDPLDVRGQQRTTTSNAMLMPNPELWSPDEVLVKTSKRSYTVNDYEDLFKDMGYPLGIKLRKMVENLLNPLSAHAPKVQLHCLYGTGVHTAASFVYEKGEFPDHEPEIIYGDGDGTVNRRSLEACNMWKDQQDQSVILKEFHGVDHIKILSDSNVLNEIKKLLM